MCQVIQKTIQVRLMGRFGLNGGINWLAETDGTLCFTCGNITKHFLTVPPSSQILTYSGVTCFRKHPISMLPMELKYHSSSPVLISCIKRFCCLNVSVSPFDNTIIISINKFIASAVAVSWSGGSVVAQVAFYILNNL